MSKPLLYLAIIVCALVLQVTLFPAYLEDPFRPNLLLIIVVYMGFRGSTEGGSVTSFTLGLLQDSFSGIYLGLHGFSYLFIFIILNRIAHRFYTQNNVLIVIGTALSTMAMAFLTLLLLAMFSVADGVYYPILAGMFPQAVINTLAASLVFAFAPLRKLEEMR